MKRLLVLACMLGIWANPAGAAIFVSTPTIAQESATVWDWTYVLTLQPEATMRDGASGDFATIYDVPNIVDLGAFNPIFGPSLEFLGNRTFEVTTQLLGVTPGVPPNPDLLSDDPLIDNVTVRLTGGGAIVGDPTAGPITIGALHIKSSTSVGIVTDYATLSEANGADSLTSGTTVVAIPEPGTVVLMMVGLLALGGFSLRRTYYMQSASL